MFGGRRVVLGVLAAIGISLEGVPRVGVLHHFIKCMNDLLVKLSAYIGVDLGNGTHH